MQPDSSLERPIDGQEGRNDELVRSHFGLLRAAKGTKSEKILRVNGEEEKVGEEAEKRETGGWELEN